MKKSTLSLLLIPLLIACGNQQVTPEPEPQEPSGEQDPIPDVEPETYLSYDERVKNIKRLGYVTGPEAFYNTMEFGLGSCDLGYPLYIPDRNQMYYFFGDSFSQNNQSGMWRSNVAGISSDFNFADGLTIDDALLTPNGYLMAIYNGHHMDMGSEVTKIPTGAIYVNGNIYMYYFSMHNWSFSQDTRMNYGGCIKSSDYGANTEYGKYLKAREYAVEKGANHKTAKELWNNNTTTFTLAEGITMDVLYNKYYFEATSEENDYSVCTMFNYNNHHFMLTGDLEEKGEQALVDYYSALEESKHLPHCDLFKGGHHGSYTASNECLLSAITPDICCVCCCGGATEYTANANTQFPAQAFIDRIAKYTSRVYITSMFNEETKTNESMNGNIVLSFNGTTVGLKASNNLIRLKDTEWFNADIYVDSSGNNVSGKGKEDFFTAETSGVTKVKRRIWPANGVQ